MRDKSEQIVEDLFRTEYGKLVSGLIRFFGAGNIQLAEDIVQETLIAALDNWSTHQIPDNPTGWLVQVAKRKALNELKHQKVVQKNQSRVLLLTNPEENLEQIFLENEIEDSQLRMIFTCCHPSLTQESQIALTLKTLCGFGIKEVANALLVSESTINKRLYRAKKAIRDSEIPFDIPQGKELLIRLDTVILTLYLLFNEGYNSSSDHEKVARELCLEAMRLVRLLATYFKGNRELYALLSLMCFHTARFEARIDHRGTLTLFEDQDRSLWNKELIATGISFLKNAKGAKELTSYHIEARIAAEHCMAKSFEDTNWESIYDQYELLSLFKSGPIIELNKAIIMSKITGLKKSLELLKQLEEGGGLTTYHLLPAVQGFFHLELKQYPLAMKYLEKAKELKPQLPELQLIESSILECKEKIASK